MNFLFAAFAAVWIVLFLFLMRIFRKQQQLSKELAVVRNELEQRKSG